MLLAFDKIEAHAEREARTFALAMLAEARDIAPDVFTLEKIRTMLAPYGIRYVDNHALSQAIYDAKRRIDPAGQSREDGTLEVPNDHQTHHDGEEHAAPCDRPTT